MTRVYLIRHGDKESVMGDPSLSKRGQEESRKTGRYLAQFGITTLLSSPLRRCQETAYIIGQELNLAYTVSDLLRERVNWGDDPGQSYEQFTAMWYRASADRQWVPPVGDSAMMAGKRMETAIGSIKGSDEKVALVTSGGILADFLVNVFPEETLEKFYPGFMRSREDVIGTCSITIIQAKERKDTLELITLASTDHLKGREYNSRI